MLSRLGLVRVVPFSVVPAEGSVAESGGRLGVESMKGVRSWRIFETTGSSGGGSGTLVEIWFCVWVAEAVEFVFGDAAGCS